MKARNVLTNAILGGVAVVAVAAHAIPGSGQRGPVWSALAKVVRPAEAAVALPPAPVPAPESGVLSSVTMALDAFENAVRPLSHSRALGDAFRSYFAFREQHPEKVRKPYLYFVDYGLPATTPRGYVFDMDNLRVVDGPFTVAHGRGSRAENGVPTWFSNTVGSYATSLGLYLAEETYGFNGRAGGKSYKSVGLRLTGLSGDYNDRARARRVVAHGAPYVTAQRAGQSEGCPAMEQWRAQKLLPEIANGGLVFLFAPETDWMQQDPWVTALNAE